MLRHITRLISGLIVVGLLLALAPSASAAATYDITQVGDADWVGVTDANGRELSGQTTASNGLQVTATVRLRIDDIGALREGDTVLVKATAASGSHFGPSLFSRMTLPPSLLDRRGNAVFTVSNAYGDASVLKLTRTGTTALGSYSCDLAATNTLWRRTPESKTSTWRIGSSSAYTFASRPQANTPCASNSNGEWVPQVQGNSIAVNQWFLNCGTMRSIMDGPDTSGIRTESQVGWARIIPESGRITSLDVPNNSTFIMKAVDGRTPGSLDARTGILRLSWKSDVDISTYDKAVANLPVGSVAVMEREDGSWDIAYNIGSRLPGLANSLKTPDSSDPATLELQRNTGNIWQAAQTTFYVRFQDESVPNRVSVETRGTEYAYRSRTLTTKPLDPAIGQGQSAIRYDPNGGDGDAFRKAGDPGTQATTPEAATFLRKGVRVRRLEHEGGRHRHRLPGWRRCRIPGRGRHPDPVRPVEARARNHSARHGRQWPCRPCPIRHQRSCHGVRRGPVHIRASSSPRTRQSPCLISNACHVDCAEPYGRMAGRFRDMS